MWGALAEAVTQGRHAEATSPDHSQLGYALDLAIEYQGSGYYDGALALPPVFAAVRLLASTITQLPVSVTGGDTPTWLRSPRRYGSALDLYDLVQLTVTSMATRGAGYLRCIRVGDSWRLDAVDARHVAFLGSSGAVVTRDYAVAGQPVPVVPASPLEAVQGRDYLLPIPYLVTPDRPEGTSPLISAAGAMKGYTDVERHAAQLLAGGTYSGGRLETDQDITKSSAELMQARWVENRKSGRIPVLGNGLRYVNDVLKPADAQFLESRAFNAAQVAQMFGIPPDILGMSMMGGQSSLSYANASDNNERFRRNALAAFTQQLEDALSLLLPPGRNAAEDRRVTFDYTDWEGVSADAVPPPER